MGSSKAAVVIIIWIIVIGYHKQVGNYPPLISYTDDPSSLSRALGQHVVCGGHSESATNPHVNITDHRKRKGRGVMADAGDKKGPRREGG